MKKKKTDGIDISHVALLANLSLTGNEVEVYLPQLTTILEFISKLQSIQTDNVPETSQVTGMTNVWREDTIEESRTFSQDEALANAGKKYNGYFVTPSLFQD